MACPSVHLADSKRSQCQLSVSVSEGAVTRILYSLLCCGHENINFNKFASDTAVFLHAMVRPNKGWERAAVQVLELSSMTQNPKIA